ncbi:MAG: ATP-binding cassette domain-containing protein [Cytophagaceae bacterium]|nr:ATP-binding cassette domain-containing protein [Cytophagaceae bacterium]
MKIDFNNITPAPMAGVIDLGTQIWNKNLSFEEGKKYKVFAPSGKGKSTFIHIIYGLRFDYTGEAKLDNINVSTISRDRIAEIRQKDFSIVFQDLRLFLDLTAMENIHVKSVLYEDDPTEKILKFAETLGVKNLLDKKARTLSYGERQRIAIVRALVQPFKWLLLDEPFSHLDKENIRKASQMISEEVNKKNAGLIVTSLGHDDYFTYDFEYQL